MSIAAKMLAAVIAASLFIVIFVVVIGGVLCINDDDYDFAEYVNDLGNVWKFLLTAIVGCLAQAYLLNLERKNGGHA